MGEVSLERSGIRRKVIALAWPSILESMMLSFVTLIDTYMVGKLGPIALAAVAINGPTNWMLNATVSAIAVGGTVYSAFYIGAKEEEKAAEVSRAAFLMIMLFGTFISVLIFVIGQWTPAWMGGEDEVLKDASDYIRIMSLCFLPHFTGVVLSGVMRGAGDTRTPMAINILVNGLNIIGNFFLIFPTRSVYLGGPLELANGYVLNFPKFTFTAIGAGWGVQGAAAASALAMGVGGVILLILLIVRKGPVQLKLKGIKVDFTMIKRMLKVGFPAALERFSTTTGVMFFTRIVASLGTVSLAAHHLAVQAESICYMPGFGFQVAATALVGQAMGAADKEEAKRYGITTFRMCTTCMILMAAILFLSAEFIMKLFSEDPEVIRLGTGALRIVAVAEPFTGAALALVGALRGAGDTKWPLFISLGSVWGVRLVLAAFFVFVLKWGLNGAWLAMGIDLMIRGIFAYIRFSRGKWMNISMDK